MDTQCTSPRRPSLLALSLLALSLLAPGLARAQSLLVTADRLGTLDLFVLDMGVERPLLISDDLAEFDPSPSPDGELIAYAATDALVASAASHDGSTWTFRLIDRAGTERWSWQLPDSDGRFRPAGGYELVWLPDGRSLLAQAHRDDFVWEVHRYFVDSARSVALGEGFGILLDPEGESFAITRERGVFVVQIADGRELALGEGWALGWTPDGEALLIERNFALLLVPLAAPSEAELIGDSGPYIALRWSLDARRYAVTTAYDGSSAIFFYDRAHRFLGSYELPGLASDLTWLDADRVAVELAHDRGWQIVTIDLAGRLRTLVADSGGAGIALLGR